MRKVRQRSMGNVEFIGELYLQKMVGDEEVHAPSRSYLLLSSLQLRDANVYEP